MLHFATEKQVNCWLLKLALSTAAAMEMAVATAMALATVAAGEMATVTATSPATADTGEPAVFSM